MGFPYPHYDAELLLSVTGVMILAAILMPVAKIVPEWAGITLMAIPLVLLLAVCVFFWFRTRRD
jgi:hypothetical protein